MPDFNAKMHQNRFRLRPSPRGEEREGEGRSTCLPTRFEGREREGRGRGEGGRERGEEGKGGGGRKGKGGERDLAPLEKKSWRCHWHAICSV